MNSVLAERRRRSVATAPLDELARDAKAVELETWLKSKKTGRRCGGLWRVLAQEHRQVLVLRYFADMTVPQVAHSLKVRRERSSRGCTGRWGIYGHNWRVWEQAGDRLWRITILPTKNKKWKGPSEGISPLTDPASRPLTTCGSGSKAGWESSRPRPVFPQLGTIYGPGPAACGVRHLLLQEWLRQQWWSPCQSGRLPAVSPGKTRKKSWLPWVTGVPQPRPAPLQRPGSTWLPPSAQGGHNSGAGDSH